MKLPTKKLFRISFCMILAGIVLTGIGMLAGGRPGVTFSGRGITSPYEDADRAPYVLEKTKLSDFSNIQVRLDSYADIQILPSPDAACYLEYRLDGAYAKPVYEVRNDTLFFTQKELSSGSIHIFNLSFGSTSAMDSSFILYVPKKQTIDSLELHNDMGNVLLSEQEIHTAEITVEYGNVDLQDVTAEELTLHLESGNLDTKSLQSDRFQLQCSYGKAMLREFQADDAKICLENGDLRLDVRDLTRLNCKNKYGDTVLRLLEDPSSYAIDVRTEYGRIRLPENDMQGYHVSSDEEESYQLKNTSGKSITLYAESGDITIETAHE